MTRYYSLTECAHGNSEVCDHIPNETRGGGCLRLDCEVLHDEPCPGGQRRELTGVEVVEWCEEHRRESPASAHCDSPQHIGAEPCRIVPTAIIPLEEPADG